MVSLWSHLSYVCLYFYLLTLTLREYQWIFTKLGMCIDIVDIWFGFVNGHISSILTELSACNMSDFFLFWMITFVNINVH